MQIVNLTDKPVSIVGNRDQTIKTYLSSGVATCSIQERREHDVDGVPIISKMYGKVHGLPLPTENLDTLYIVDITIAKAIGDVRFDLLVPDGGFLKDGQVFYRKLELV